MSTIPVTYAPNAERLFLATDEFGFFAAVLADTFEEAHAEALCVMHERDGSCDHDGGSEDDCDCDLSDDGPVWAIYLGLTETRMTREQFEDSFGEDVERIDRELAAACVREGTARRARPRLT